MPVHDEATGTATSSWASPRPAGLEVELFNEHVFSEIRSRSGVPDNFVDGGWSLEQLAPGGGKGGSLMAKVGWSFIVKELSRSDHGTLLEVAQSYGEHVTSPSLLGLIYLHFRDLATGRAFFAMQNGVGQGPFVALYDLKGCADDKLLERDGQPIRAVHKRIWNVHMWLSRSSWSEERKRYYSGKQQSKDVGIQVTSRQRGQIVNCLQRDTRWLADHGLMDYSLLVGIRASTSLPGATGYEPRQLVRRDRGGCVTTHLCIIDFLQKWTLGKKVARVLKVLESNKATVPPPFYASRFASHFESRFQEVEEPQPAPLAHRGGQGSKARGTPMLANSTGSLGCTPQLQVLQAERRRSSGERREPHAEELATKVVTEERLEPTAPLLTNGATHHDEPSDFCVSPNSDAADSPVKIPSNGCGPAKADKFVEDVYHQPLELAGGAQQVGELSPRCDSTAGAWHCGLFPCEATCCAKAH